MLSLPATILACIYAIITILSLGLVIRDKRFTAGYVISSIIWILFAVLIVYDTACLTTGQCTAWSWIRTVLYAILPVIVIIMYMFALASPETKEEEQKKP